MIGDPLLKLGIAALILATGFSGVALAQALTASGCLNKQRNQISDPCKKVIDAEEK
jgi:hypothetical protein